MTTIAVKVTAEHIAKGEPFDMDCCPVALALNESVPGKKWQVANRKAWVGRGEDRYSLPEVACQFYRDFDFGRPVAPFDFTLTLPGAQP